MLTINAPTIGEIMVPASAVMEFVSPMWGFATERSFALVPAARDGLWWLIGTEAPNTAFVLADPFIAFPDYVLDLPEQDRAVLGLDKEHAAMVLVMLTLPSESDRSATANLRAPLVFNVERQRVLQVVSPNETHSLQQPVTLSQYPLREGSEPSSD